MFGYVGGQSVIIDIIYALGYALVIWLGGGLVISLPGLLVEKLLGRGVHYAMHIIAYSFLVALTLLFTRDFWIGDPLVIALWLVLLLVPVTWYIIRRFWRKDLSESEEKQYIMPPVEPQEEQYVTSPAEPQNTQTYYQPQQQVPPTYYYPPQQPGYRPYRGYSRERGYGQMPNNGNPYDRERRELEEWRHHQMELGDESYAEEFFERYDEDRGDFKD